MNKIDGGDRKASVEKDKRGTGWIKRRLEELKKC